MRKSHPFDSPLNCDAGNMLRAGDYVAFNNMANMYCIEYAKSIPPHLNVDTTKTTVVA